MLRDRLLHVSMEEEERKLREWLAGLKMVTPEKEQIFQFYQGVAKKTLAEVKKLYDETDGCMAFEAKKIPVIGKRYLHAAAFFRAGQQSGEPCWEIVGFHLYYSFGGHVLAELFAKRLRDKKKMPVVAILEGSETRYAKSFRLAGFSKVSKTEHKTVLKTDKDWALVTEDLRQASSFREGENVNGYF